MALIRNGRIVADAWRRLDDDEPAPAEGAILVTLDRWRRERAALSARGAGLGILLASHEAPAEIAADLGKLDLIALDFPKFTDGRAYSSARLLRERFGYRGELRAVGNVLKDQLFFMHRCGFDAFDLPDEVTARRWLTALEGLSVVYQPTGDGRSPAWALRRRAGVAAAGGRARAPRA